MHAPPQQQMEHWLEPAETDQAWALVAHLRQRALGPGSMPLLRALPEDAGEAAGALMPAPGPGGGEAVADGDPREQDDRAPQRRSFILRHQGAAVGTVRLEALPQALIIQRLGILPEMQRRGHGAALLRLIERLAKAEGCRRLCLNARHVAIPWYLDRGFRLEDWDVSRATVTSRQMVRDLGPVSSS